MTRSIELLRVMSAIGVPVRLPTLTWLLCDLFPTMIDFHARTLIRDMVDAGQLAHEHGTLWIPKHGCLNVSEVRSGR